MIRDFVLPAALLSLAQLTFCHGAQKVGEPAANVIPAEMRGRWGITRADCDVTQGDGSGAMLVSSEMLGFPESHARLATSDTATPQRISASYAVSDEGERAMTLSLSGDGQTLTRIETDPDAEPVSNRYRRCD
ncbi:hypothetical protein Q4543_00570 [Salipiger sp. 1_MG-2023]|uniref:hypothetical protein n=1 Tax=Salipiger sp. 1_MG-2023 TaxID=3062665 RepID=UPI0026E41050|nr:hypothetical protein [Salipiger sp. 1_MG-2023]MDO6584000.1 hypothetical protein [Salipiger sp. 1_MG-2023]